MTSVAGEEVLGPGNRGRGFPALSDPNRGRLSGTAIVIPYKSSETSENISSGSLPTRLASHLVSRIALLALTISAVGTTVSASSSGNKSPSTLGGSLSKTHLVTGAARSMAVLEPTTAIPTGLSSGGA